MFESLFLILIDVNCCDFLISMKNIVWGKLFKELKKIIIRKSRSNWLFLIYEKFKDFVEKINDVRLVDDGKSMKCLFCGKNLKLDNSKRLNSGCLKYFRCVYRCFVCVEVEGFKIWKIDEFYDFVEE